MALRRDITTRLTDLLAQNPQGLSITEIVKMIDINRNTAGRYLDNLLISGQVEMRPFGMAKIYRLSERVPVSSVLSLSSEFVMQIDNSLRVVFLNKPFALLIGTDEEEFTGKNLEFTKIPSFFDDTYPELLTAIRNGISGTASRGELDLVACDRSFSYRIIPIVFTSGQKGASLIFEDITDRKHGEALLRESEEKFRALFNNASDMITLHGFGPDGLPGQYIEVNEEACRRLGYSREELLALSPRDIIASECAGVMARNAQALHENGHATFEILHRTKNGKKIPVEIRTHVFEFRGRSVAIALVQDITERNRIEAALKESEARYRSLAEASRDMIFVVDRDDRVLYVNQRAAAFHDITPDEMIGKPRGRFFPPDVSAGQLRGLRQVFSSGEPVRSESPMITPGGKVLWFDHALMPISDAMGNVTSVLGVSRDITKRVAAEQEHRLNEENNRFIAEHSVDIIHRLDPECVLLYTSPSVKTLLGYEPEEVLGKSVVGMIHPDDLPGVIQDLQGIHESGKQTTTSTFRFRHKDGQYILFESTTRIIRDHNGKVKEFLNISRDISGRERQDP